VNISIIVPVFNSEKYLIRWLDSLFNQRFSGCFEVIVVDYGSTDRSPEILKTYQKTKNSLRVITHDFNKKQSVARSTGMNIANGDYIMFLDSDDWFIDGTLERVYAKSIETNADIVAFNPVRVDSNGNMTPLNYIKEEVVTQDKLYVQKHFMGGYGTKIVKKKLTENLISGSSSVNTTEDLLYNTEILLRASTICLVPEDHYVYFLNRESVTRTVEAQQYLSNQIIILDELHEILMKFKTDPQFVNNILDYLEKWIYMMLSESQFSKREKVEVNGSFFRAWELFPEMTKTRIRNMERSVKYKYYCLYNVFKLFGPKTALGFIYRGLGLNIIKQ